MAFNKEFIKSFFRRSPIMKQVLLSKQSIADWSIRIEPSTATSYGINRLELKDLIIKVQKNNILKSKN